MFFQCRNDGETDHFLKLKKSIAEKKKMALELKEASRVMLQGLLLKAIELDQAVESPSCTEETRKAHSDAQKMVDVLEAELSQRIVEIVTLEEEEKVIDSALEALKNL